MIDAVAWGYDRSDRFQSVTSWRGEATPKVSIRGETTESEPLLEGWRYWRLAAPGWPGPAPRSTSSTNSAGRPGDGRWGWRSSWPASPAAAPRARLRATVLTLLLAVTIFALVLCPARLCSSPGVHLAGVLGVALLWLGASVPGPGRRRRRAAFIRPRCAGSIPARPPPYSWRWSPRGWCRLPSPALRSPSATANRRSSPLLPYDGPPDPDRRPDRVILRREDAEHLRPSPRSPAPHQADRRAP